MTAKQKFIEVTNVSRETQEKFERYETLLRKWNASINLVAKSTLDDIWGRHFLDSISAFKIQANWSGKWVDLGSGGGFPAIANALLAQDKGIKANTVCIETDIRKSEFLRTVARNLDLNLTVLTRRIADCPTQNAQVITARALAPLNKLLEYLKQHLDPTGVALLHKGRDWKIELDQSLISWRFDHDVIPSLTDPDAVVLKIGNLRNV